MTKALCLAGTDGKDKNPTQEEAKVANVHIGVVACFFGYCIAGKGFSYISPAPPLYIGEILFSVMGLMFLFGNIGAPLAVAKKHIIIKFLLSNHIFSII